MARYTLVGVDGNAYSIMAFTQSVMKKAGLGEHISTMHKRATSGDYDNLICVCNEYVEMSNDLLGLTDDDDDDYGEEVDW